MREKVKIGRECGEEEAMMIVVLCCLRILREGMVFIE